MCTSPIKILNPKYKTILSDYDRDADGLYLKVACGKCPTCQYIHNQEWMTRMAYEYEYTKLMGGYVYWDTLTYDEECVPEIHGLKVFNSKHYTSFIKKLRVNLQRRYEQQLERKEIRPEDIERYNPKGKIKIMFVSEYGGQYGRPHYHIQIYVTYPIDWLTLSKLVRKSWIHGLTDGELHPVQEQRVIQSWKGIAYCAKYIQKDIEFERVLKEQKNSRFYKWIKEVWPSLYGEMFNERAFEANRCDKFKQILKELDMDEAIPFMRVSRHFGEYAMTKLTDKDYEIGTTIINDNDSIYKTVKIPTYIMRKKLYDYDKVAKSWSLNDFGKHCKAMQLDERIHQQYLNLDMYMQFILNGNYVKDSELENVNVNRTYVRKVWEDIKRDNKLHQKLIYTLVFRDYASDYIKKNLENEEIKEIVQDIIANRRFNKDREHDNTSLDLNLKTDDLYITIGNQMMLQSETLRYIISVYDTAERLFATERARYLEEKQLQLNRVKQFKVKPYNITRNESQDSIAKNVSFDPLLESET